MPHVGMGEGPLTEHASAMLPENPLCTCDWRIVISPSHMACIVTSFSLCYSMQLPSEGGGTHSKFQTLA
jgi:hypothetical protein